MDTNTSTEEWAERQFGLAELGDRRRTQRLVAMAASVLERPAGKITQVFTTSAQRQGAYGLIENPQVTHHAVARAAYDATARQAAPQRFVFVPVDDSSFRVVDPGRTKGTGSIGSKCFPARGFKVMNALAVEPDGTTLGLLGQRFWARPSTRVTTDRHKRVLEEKETRYWEWLCTDVHARLKALAPDTTPWFQKDRGADSADLLLRDLRAERLMTVRACYDRHVCAPLRRVRAQVAAAPLAGVYALTVPGGKHRKARVAQMEVRHLEVDLNLLQRIGNRRWSGRVWVVWTREVGTTPPGETPLDWLLYTTYPVETLGDALLVLVGYGYRWRVEEFHKTWKSGGCRVQDTELRAAERILKWATILGVVATRLMQLRDDSRAQPEVPAATHLSEVELRALVLLRQPRGYKRGQVITLGQAVRWIADLGGYTGPSSGGPPGIIVLGRGWEKVQVVCQALRNMVDDEI